MLHTVGTDNYGWCSKEGMFQCDVKVILVHGPLQKYRGLFYEFMPVRYSWRGRLVSKTNAQAYRVRISRPVPNMGDMLQGVTGDCKSSAETHARFDSWIAHQKLLDIVYDYCYYSMSQ